MVAMKRELRKYFKGCSVVIFVCLLNLHGVKAQSFNVPTIDPDYFSMNMSVLSSTSSFGGVNCPTLNVIGSQSGKMLGLPNATPCSALLGFTPIPEEKSALGEESVSADMIDDALNSGNPDLMKDPFGNLQGHVNGFLDGPTASACPAGYQDEDSYPAVNLDISLTEEERERLLGDLSDQPNWRPAGRQGALVELPSTGNSIADQEAAGYYRYNDGDRHVYATDRVAWNIQAAGRILADKKIVMGVGELSARNGATPGHTEHQGGRDVDLRLVGDRDSNGVARARPCTVHNSGCYDRENTFEMVKAFIDVDPYGIDKVFINDPTLQRMINNYMSEAYGISKVNGRSIARSCGGHDNHVHLSFKNSGANPDDLARRAQ